MKLQLKRIRVITRTSYFSKTWEGLTLLSCFKNFQIVLLGYSQYTMVYIYAIIDDDDIDSTEELIRFLHNEKTLFK